MREVQVGAAPLSRLDRVLLPERAVLLRTAAARASRALAGATVWNVSSTAQGGGVAEMLHTLLAYGRGAGIETRWFVITGDERFFTITKRLHNLLHGYGGDGAGLDVADLDHYQKVLAGNLAGWQDAVRAGDLVLLHDPQTASMAEPLRRRGARVVWRCHIGADRINDHTRHGWAFLRPFAEAADACAFSRAQYAPAWLPPRQVWVIPPSLDPLSAKNVDLTVGEVQAALQEAGLVACPRDWHHRHNGRRPPIDRSRPPLLDEDAAIPGEARLMLQVSRWDRLKDMPGVLVAFSEHLDLFPHDVHLLLAGPDVEAVRDDPEGAQVLAECRALRTALPAPARARVHLGCLPMDDVARNAHLVNALQRHAAVVTQKSVAEGFGLTVTEPMWKRRAVVASAVGGIVDQIEDGVSGVLLDDPADLDRFAHLVADLLTDHRRRAGLGTAARQRVLANFLPDRHLIQYGELFLALRT